jgi:hypothetical protein
MPASTTPTVSEVERAQAQAVGGKKDRCLKGKSCSATCIDPNETCLVEFPTPVSGAISKMRDGVEGGEDKKTQKEIDFLKEYAQDYKDRLYKSVRRAIQDERQERYDKLRSEIIEFNSNVKKQGYGDEFEPIKVPISYDKAMKIKKVYEKTLDRSLERMEKFGYQDKRDKFDAEIAKLDKLHQTLGKRLGYENPRQWVKDWSQYQDNDLAKRLYQRSDDKALKGWSIIPKESSDQMSLRTNVGKNVVEIILGDRGAGFSFKVNGEYSADDSIPKRERYTIALKVKDAFQSIVKSMNEGSVVEVTPARADGKGDARKSAYETYGFKSEGGSDFLYGKVQNGKIVGSTYEEFETFARKGDFNFRESLDSFRLFYQMLWGEAP